MKLNELFMRNMSLGRAFAYSFKRVSNSSINTGKVIAVRKKIARGSVEVLEAKPASSVLKKFNWENHHLFGGVVKSSVSNGKKRQTEWRDKVNCFKAPLIQYESNLPVFQKADFPSTSYDSPISLNSCDAIVRSDESEQEHFSVNSENILNTILRFPLLNDTSGNNFKDEASLLRTHLQSVSTTIPSVTAILDKTMPPYRKVALEQWKMRMIDQMGKEGFEVYQKEMLSSGSTFHSTINAFLHGTPESDLVVPESNMGHWKSVQNVVPNICNVKLLEERVTHPFLQYGGVVDCIAHYGDQLVVVEWKTSKKCKATLKSTYDSPLQLAAYVGALNFDPRFQYMVDKGLIVVVYEEGNPAHCHFLGKELLNEYWTEWLKRLKSYWESL